MEQSTALLSGCPILFVSVNNNCVEKTTPLELNFDTFELTYTVAEKVTRISLEDYLFSYIPPSKPGVIEINFAQNVLIPRTISIFCACNDDLQVVKDFLLKWGKMRGQRSFTNQLLPAFLQREFAFLCSDAKQDFLVPEAVTAYLNKTGLRLPISTRSLARHDWTTLYHQMMDLEKSNILKEIFSWFSTQVMDNVPRIMKPEDLLNFLQHYQKEEGVLTKEQLMRVMQTHISQDGNVVNQGGITCGAIEEASRSLKAIDERNHRISREKNFNYS